MLREMMATGMLLILCHGCAGVAHSPTTPHIMDHHSHARPTQVRVVHLDLDLALDFDAHKIEGAATLSLERPDLRAPLILDVRGLDIGAITGSDGQPRPFALKTGDALLGDALCIDLAEADSKVTITYATRPEADALQWLGPEQTAGDSPFLYTQGQAILTRTWIPLQDSPGVRVTFDARVRAPAELQVVMAAEPLGPDPEDPSVRRFTMPQAIPSYLIALACGDLAFREISPRCGVWAAPTIVEAAVAEFEDMDDMLRACEGLFGPYRWGRYDLLILPAAFPFGGMENPRLTFATPTIIAGDKSLVALVAHELAHSWSGNLVTNATWSDFWLNEGFTVYLEQRIMEAVFGEERARMEILIGMQGLDEELPRLDEELRKLHPELRGRNPDDNMTAVPYDKGAALLRTIEARVGRPAFDAFLQGWFSDHAFQSATTAEFLTYLQDKLLLSESALDLAEWIDGTSIPADAHRPSSRAFEAVDAQRSAWRGGAPARDLETHGWVTHQWLHFFNNMPDTLEPSAMDELDSTFGFTQTRNAEILAAWLRLCIRHEHHAARSRLEEFLLEVGRRKFLEPLYREMAKTPDGRERALAIYRRARPRYHAITQRSLDETLKSP